MMPHATGPNGTPPDNTASTGTTSIDTMSDGMLPSTGSNSVSGTANVPAPPHPTPSEGQSPHDIDLTAVTRTLGPIQEDLNEAAEEAMYPSPPINTPNTPSTFSPAASIIARPSQRSRGLSALSGLPERLAQHSLGHRMFRNVREADASSRASDPIDEDGEVDGEDTESNAPQGSPFGSPVGSINIALGSPVTNPRILEYRSFTGLGNTNEQGTGGESSSGHGAAVGRMPEGVMEQTVWADDVMADLEHALKRVEQLAEDLAAQDLKEPGPGEERKPDPRSASEHFLERLKMVMEGRETKFPVIVNWAPEFNMQQCEEGA